MSKAQASGDAADWVIMRKEPIPCPIIRIRIDGNFWTFDTYKLEKHDDGDSDELVKVVRKLSNQAINNVIIGNGSYMAGTSENVFKVIS